DLAGDPMRVRPLFWLRSQMRAADLCRGDNETVTLRRLLRPERPLGLGRNEATPQGALRALKRALERQKKRLALAEAGAADVQLLGQVTSATEWPKLLAYWERRNPSGVA